MTQIDFTPFPKIARWRRQVVITEKIDGTNAAVVVKLIDGTKPTVGTELGPAVVVEDEAGNVYTVSAQSRKRVIWPGNDNFAFALWVRENAQELVRLGEGVHFGEWWGSGIQRGYGLPVGEKRFSLFNVSRWGDDDVRPACCHVVPLLAQHDSPIDTLIDDTIRDLREHGSYAAPFMNPEGIVIYHAASRTLFKRLLENDDVPKTLVA
jgi:hypothetical protein